MITGDHVMTALYVAGKCQLLHANSRIILATTIDDISDASSVTWIDYASG